MDRVERIVSVLAQIVERTRREVTRRKPRMPGAPLARPERARAAVTALRRGEGALNVIAEVKFRSPSAGEIRPRTAGEAVRVARAYVDGGASAVSVLADRASFGGGPLDVRRVAAAISQPVLFKGFVVDPCQVELASHMGASMVLLLVRSLAPALLQELVEACDALGVAPLVEAADEAEVEIASRTSAQLIGVNARDLRSFEVDPERARSCLAHIPENRVAIYMSGVRSAADLAKVSAGRADAVLIGEGLMRAREPGRTLASWLQQGEMK